MHLTSKEIGRFFAGIVIPSILAIILFIISIYVFIIPTFEKNIMDKKREMLRELVNTTWSLMEEYDKDYKDSLISLQEAKELSIKRIEKIRYGDENKDYFWITDMNPNMIMHPYRKELNGTDLNNYKDQAGKLLFVEAVNLVEKENEGYIDYMWQWKDDSTKIVPKLSFVKKFNQWGWIIGTGIYLEDVKEEINALKTRLIKITFIILGIISVIVAFIIKQSLDIEKRRKSIEDKLKSSRRKYQSLVEASIDGTILIINDQIIFSNAKFNDSFGSSASYVLSLHFNDIFDSEWDKVKSLITKKGKSETFETRLKSLNKPHHDVILTISKVFFGKQEAYIIITKDLTKIKLVEKQTEQLSNEVQTSLLLMNQPIKHFINDFISCNLNDNVLDIAQKMTRKKEKIIFVKQDEKIVGAINDKDIRERAVAKNHFESSAYEVMSAPVIFIQEDMLLYEAVLLFKQNNVSHLMVKNNLGNIIGVISNQAVLEMQRNSLSYMVNEVNSAENIDQIQLITQRLPILIRSLIDSGARTQNVTKIITSLTDAINKRIINFAIEKLGVPPCKFAFVAMGSEGRMEQTLATDQDNAIIFENVKTEIHDHIKDYFVSLGKLVSHNLNQVGYKFCNGEVMASNPKWVMSLTDWENQFKTWINNSDPKSILEASIFFDFRCIYGADFLTNDLQISVFEMIKNKAVFFQHLANPILKYKSTVNFFGNIVGDEHKNEQAAFNIKKIILPITSFIRIYSLRNNIIETNSLNRLEKLKSLKLINESLYNEIEVSFNYLMLLRFKSQTKQFFNNQDPDNLIVISELTDIEKTTIKKIISEISNLQTQLSADFKGVL